MSGRKLGYKIKVKPKTKKIPYQLVCGDNEVNNNLITYRKYGSNQTTTVTTGEFITMIKQEIQFQWKVRDGTLKI